MKALNKEPGLLLIGLLAVGLSLTACGGGGGGGGGAAGTGFTSVELADLSVNGTFSAGIAINNQSMVVGVSDDGLGLKAAKWNLALPGSAVKLAPLGGEYSAAYGINEPGVVVGESGNASGATVAVYWPAGLTTPTALNATGLAGENSAAYGINNENRIVGEADDGLENTMAVFWADPAAAPTVLAGLSSNPGTSAYFISTGNMIVGESRNTSGAFQAVAWMPAVGGGYGPPLPLATIAGQVSGTALGVDADGNIVGEAELGSGAVHGVVWDTSGVVVGNLGADTSAQAITQGAGSNRIVGYTAAQSGNDRAAVWNSLSLADTTNVEVALSQAYGVNDSVNIVGMKNNKAFVAVPQ